MIRRFRNNEPDEQHRDRWLISYADLVTLLLALFIVMYAASDHERARQIAAGFASESGGAGILPGSSDVASRDNVARRILEDPVLSAKTKMQQTERGLIVSLSEAGFFAPGDAALSPDADAAIAALAEALKATPMPVRVEGHTDSTPISNSRYPSNWELSTARASSVLARLIDRGIAPERLSAAGYAGFQPAADNATADGRARNRRVDVIVVER